MNVFTNELNKLINMNKHINEELIQASINHYWQFDVFQILNAFIRGDLNSFIVGWKGYIEVNSNIFGFVALLGGQLITLRNALLLRQQGYTNQDIASRLVKNPYIIKKILDENKLKISEINDKIKVLYTLEKNIKEGIFDNKIIPELEFIRMFCN
ncbi:hypothetical protein [Spiroplasma clarkii]|nr:hypothetical protein [Spiroplasma clarkii]